MAYDTFVQSTGSPNFLAKYQHANRDFLTNQDNEQHIFPYNIQGQRNNCPPVYNLQRSLQNGVGVPQNCHPNLSSKIQMTVPLNYQPQPQYQPNGFNTSQHPVQTFLHASHQPSQNVQLPRSSSSSNKVNPQTAPVGGLHTHSPHTRSPHTRSPHFTLPAHTNSSAVLPTCESFQQTLQVPQGYSQQNQQIPSLHNQQSITAIPTPCTTAMQSNKQSLESANLLQQHKPPYYTSNADLIQSSQMNHPSFGNMHTRQGAINKFGHEFPFSSSNMSHMGNQIMSNQIRTSTNANSINQSNLSIYNHLYNMQGLNNPMSSYGCNPLTEHREIAPTNQQYLDNSQILLSNSLALSSAGILPNQNVHSRSMNPHPGLLQNKGNNVIYPGNLSLTNVMPENINPTSIERSNGHPFVDSSSNNHQMNEESSINSHPTTVQWNESSVKGNGRSFHWYKYPESQNDSPFTSDVQAMQADLTDHTSAANETCSRTQPVKSTLQNKQIAQAESRTRINNIAPADEIQDKLNSSRKENNCRSSSSKSEDHSICQNFKTEAVTNNESSIQSAAPQTANKKNGSETAKSVANTARKKTGRDTIISDKDVADNSNVSKPLNLCQNVSLSNNSTIMKPSDKETLISTNQQSISPPSQVDISARNQSPDVNRQSSSNIQSSTKSSSNIQSSTKSSSNIPSSTKSSSNIQSSTNSVVSTTADNVKGSVIGSMQQNSGSLVKTTMETQTSSSLVNTTLEAQTGSETPVTITKKAADLNFMKKSVLDDPKLTDGNNVTGVAASVENRRNTSPSLSGRKLPDIRHESQKLPVQRQLSTSLYTKNGQSQGILHRQNQACCVDDQNNLNQQKVSSPRHSIATPEKLQSGSCEKKTMTAREKVFNSWKSGHLVGKVSGAGRGKSGIAVSRILKRTHSCTNPGGELSKRLTLREMNTAKEIPVRSTLATNSTRRVDVRETPHQAKMDKIKQICTMIYIMFHGHKLICLKSDTESQILLCQFLYECFPDTGLGSVNNCIDRTLQINKMQLDHPEKEKIVMFLKKNGYQIENLVQTISVTDARKIYHHMFEITNCTNATCVIEMPDSTVDLNVFGSTCSRKTLTREIMSRIAKVEHFEEQDKDPEKSADAFTDAEHRVEVDDNARKNLSVQPLSSQLAITVSPPTLHPGSPGSDHTVAYGKGGEDGPADLTIVIIVEDPLLISWSPGTLKVGGISNTCLGQLRSYRHNNETFLAVEDLCTVLGATKFYHGVMEGNIILYSCCQEIENFLNSFSGSFPPLKSQHNSLVKASDIGLNSTVTAHCNSEQDGNSLLKRPVCKVENLNEDSTPSKQARLCDTNMVKNEFSMVNGQKEFSEMNVIQKGKCNEFPFMNFKKFELDPDRIVAGMEMTDIMIQGPQNEVSAGECNLTSTVAKSPANMSVQCRGTDNFLCNTRDSQPLQESTSRDLTNTLSTYDRNNVMMVGSKDIAIVTSVACSSPCSLKSLACPGEPFTPTLGDVNNPTTPSPLNSSDQNSLKSLVPCAPAIYDDSLDTPAKSVGNSLSLAENHHVTTQQPVEYIVTCRRPEQESASSGSKHLEIPCTQGQSKRPEQESASSGSKHLKIPCTQGQSKRPEQESASTGSKHLEVPCTQGQNSFTSINNVPECFKESESKISCNDLKIENLTCIHMANNLVDSCGSTLCTSSLTNDESAGGEASLSNRDISLIDENLPHNQDVTADITDIAVESTCDLNKNDNSTLAKSIKVVPESIKENITAKAAGLVKSSLEFEVTQQQKTRTRLSLLMLALSNDIESASTLPSLHILGNQRAIDDIDVMTCSSTGILVPPSCRKAFTRLWQQQRALLGVVDSLKKQLQLSEAAKDASDKKSKFYEDLIEDMTSTFKICDMKSVDC